MKIILNSIVFILTLIGICYGSIGYNSLCTLDGGDLKAKINHSSSPTCPDGSIEIEIFNGISPYTFKWSDFNNPNNIISTSQNLDHLLPGKYCVYIEDVYGGEVCGCWDVGVNKTIIRLKEIINPTNCYESNGLCNNSNTGSIEIDVVTNNQNYTLVWSNGATSKKISQLVPGYYTATVTLANGCIVQETYELCCCKVNFNPGSSNGLCTKCYFDVINTTLEIKQYTIVNPSTDISSDGSIRLNLINGDYKYVIWNGPNNYYSNDKDIFKLKKGQYCVKLSNGCEEITKCFDLIVCDDEAFVIKAHVKNTCPNQSKGIIGYLGSTSNYKYQWENGSKLEYRDNLAKGIYYVTITNVLNSCIKVDKHEIKEILPPTLIKEIITPSCTVDDNEQTDDIPAQENGSIRIQINPGESDIAKILTWWDHLPNKRNDLYYSVFDLKPGQYKLHISYDCGEIEKTYIVPQSKIKIDLATDKWSTNWNCNNGVLSGDIIPNNISSTSPPLYFKWSNGATTPNIYNIPMGKYSLTITDATGCSAIKAFDLSPFYYDLLLPCAGLDNLGQLFVYANNKTKSELTIKYQLLCDGCSGIFTLINKSKDEFPSATISNLDETDIKLIFEFDDCIYEKIVKINYQNPKEKFINYDDNTGLCNYDLFCNYNKITNFNERPYKFDTKCDKKNCPGLDLYCKENILVKTIYGSRKKLRKEQARALAWSYGYDKGSQFDAIYANISPCAYIELCVTDPTCFIDDWIWKGNVSKGGDFVGYVKEGNCYKIKCRYGFIIPRNYKVCDDNFRPDEWDKYLGPSHFKYRIDIGGDYNDEYDNDTDGSGKNCTQFRTENWEVMRNNLEFYRINYGEVEVSEFLKALTNSKVGYDFMGNQVRHNCTEITYCLKPFKFISQNVNEVDCYNLSANCFIDTEFDGFQFTHTCGSITIDGQTYVLCDECPGQYDKNGCPRCLRVKKLRNAPLPITPFGPTTPINESFVLPLHYKNMDFQKLTYFTTEDNNILVNGIMKDQSNKGTLMNEHPLGNSYSTFESDTENVHYAYNDVNTGFFCNSYYDNNQKSLKFYSGNSNDISLFDFTANEFVEYLNLIPNSNGFNLSINYNGELYLDNSIIGNTTLGGTIISKYNINSNSFNLINFNNVKTIPFKGKEKQYQLFNVNDLNYNMSMNGSNYSNNNGNLILFDLNNSLILNTNLNVNNYSILDYCSLGEKVYIAIAGGNSLMVDTLLHNSIFTNSIFIIELINGKVNKFKEYDGFNILNSSLNIECNINGDIVFAYSEKVQDLPNNYDTIPQLNYNIKVNIIDSFLATLKMFSYGSNNDEELKDAILSDDGFLFFGGNIYGRNLYSNLGDVEFVKLFKADKNPFISYMSINNPSSNVIIRNKKAEILKMDNVYIYPNPTTDCLYLKTVISEYHKIKVKLYNSMGYLIKEINLDHLDSVTPYKFDIFDIPNGIYFISIENESKIIQVQKIIKN